MGIKKIVLFCIIILLIFFLSMIPVALEINWLSVGLESFCTGYTLWKFTEWLTEWILKGDKEV